MIRGPEQKSDLRLDDVRYGNTPDKCVNCPCIPIELDTYLSVPSTVIIYPSRCNQPISPECACIRAIDINVFVLSCRRSSFHNKWRSYIILMFFQVEDDHVQARGHVTSSYQVRNSHWSPAYTSWMPVPLGLRLI